MAAAKKNWLFGQTQRGGLRGRTPCFPGFAGLDGDKRRLSPSPGGRAGIMAAVRDYMAAHPRSRPKNRGSERPRDVLSGGQE